jgi:PhnB protein
MVRGADIPGADTMRSAYLTLNLEPAGKAEEVYILTEGGEIFMPLAQTPWANRFAMLRDRFGV